MLKVKSVGFSEGKDLFGRAASNYETSVGLSLLEFGEHAVAQMKKRISSNVVKPEKDRANGQPTLVDDGVYRDSYKSQIIGNAEMGIGPTGQNTGMSNAALGDKLEFGDGKEFPARPHQRPWREEMRKEAPRVIGKSFVAKIFQGK